MCSTRISRGRIASRASSRSTPSAHPRIRSRSQGLRHRLETLIAPMIERAGGELSIPPAMGDADLIHAIAQYLDFEPIEKQALLECQGLLARAAALIELLEIKTFGNHMPPISGSH